MVRYVTLTRPLFLLYWQMKSPRPGLLKQDNNYVNQCEYRIQCYEWEFVPTHWLVSH
jgi:hypothetical protein